VPVGIEVETACSVMAIGASTAMAELLCGLSVSGAVAEIGDEIAVLDQAEPALALGILRRPMGRGPKGDVRCVTGQVAAAAATGQFQLDVRIAQYGDIAIAPSVDLQAG
jgi:hypothetical protein